jgi:hypothetical protein
MRNAMQMAIVHRASDLLEDEGSKRLLHARAVRLQVAEKIPAFAGVHEQIELRIVPANVPETDNAWIREVVHGVDLPLETIGFMLRMESISRGKRSLQRT